MRSKRPGTLSEAAAVPLPGSNGIVVTTTRTSRGTRARTTADVSRAPLTSAAELSTPNAAQQTSQHQPRTSAEVHTLQLTTTEEVIASQLAGTTAGASHKLQDQRMEWNAKCAELDLAKQQVQLQQERIHLLEQQLEAQQQDSRKAALEATSKQAMLLNKLASLMSQRQLQSWLYSVGLLDEDPNEQPLTAQQQQQGGRSRKRKAGLAAAGANGRRAEALLQEAQENAAANGHDAKRQRRFWIF